MMKFDSATQSVLDAIRADAQERWPDHTFRIRIDSGGTGASHCAVTITRMSQRAGRDRKLLTLGEFTERGRTKADALRAIIRSLNLSATSLSMVGQLDRRARGAGGSEGNSR